MGFNPFVLYLRLGAYGVEVPLFSRQTGRRLLAEVSVVPAGPAP